MSAERLAQVEQLIGEMDQTELEVVSQRINNLRQRAERKPERLWGCCANLFPDDFDVVAAVREIRRSWHHRIAFADEKDAK